MPVRVDVRPELLDWARARSGITDEAWSERFAYVDNWMTGDKRPTFKQLEKFAQQTHTPFGMLLLPEPPIEPVPITDFRSVTSAAPEQPTANLLDTIYVCQQRQEWFRDFARSQGADPLPFVASATLETAPVAVAAAIAEKLGWNADTRRAQRTWSDALTALRHAAEDLGILVMISGVAGVGNDKHRALNVEEFRGFALVDPLAPLVFVNGRDSKAAQVFTLVHELAHIWLGEGGVSDIAPESLDGVAVERWCNRVAAEVIVPMAEFRALFQPTTALTTELDRLARHFKVSTLTILVRIREAGFLSWDEFRTAFAAERERVMGFKRPASGGGDFYNTLFTYVGRRFAESIVASTLEGTTLYRDASRLLGFTSQSTFDGAAARLGYA